MPGDRAQRLGLVLSGAVHIVREDFWGNRTIVGLAESGEVFAESYACLGSEPLEVSALAAVETEVLFLDAGRAVAGCGRGCAAHAQLSRNLLALLAGRNLALTRKMGHMARRTTRDKVLSFLSAQALRAGDRPSTYPGPATAGGLSGGGPQRPVGGAEPSPGRGGPRIPQKPLPLAPPGAAAGVRGGHHAHPRTGLL